MNIIKTKNFELAINTAGDPNSEKVALVLPGRLDTKDYANNLSHIEYLAKHGYYALSLDPPGTWNSPGGIELFTTTNYVKAVNELIEFLGNKLTLLFGHSRGGTVAMLVGTVNPHVTHIITNMSYYGAPSAPTDECRLKGYQVSLRDMPPGTEKGGPQKRFELPLNYFEEGMQYNVTEAIKVCRKPKLFFYGVNDLEMNPEDVKEMYKFASEPKFIHELNSEHRYWRHLEIIEEVNKTVGEFLNYEF